MTLKLPMQFISMHLIGPFELSTDGHLYVLMVICTLIGYTFCILLRQTVTNVVQTYVDKVYAKFWGSSKNYQIMG